MPQIIKEHQVVEDDWQIVNKPANGEALALSSGKLILPAGLWLAEKDQLATHRGKLGVWLDSDEPPELIVADLDFFPVIAINFPAFTDGRGYSYARKLREYYGYKGELRAIGDVLRDQLFFMKRCGFNAFSLRTDRDIHQALESLNDFAHCYQAASDQHLPLFRQRW